MKNNFPTDEYKYISANVNNNYINNYTNNTIQKPYEPKNQNFINISYSDLKKIIKEEFDSQIIPYKNEIIKLKKIIININKCQEPDKDLIRKRMESSINFSANNLNISQNNIISNIQKEINKLKSEINNFKSIKSLKSDSQILQLNKKEKEQFDFIINLRNNVENIKKDTAGKKKIYDDMKLNLENLKASNLNLTSQITQIKAHMKKLEESFKIESENNSINNLNIYNEAKIFEILGKLNLTKLSNFDIGKFYTIRDGYSALIDNYMMTSEIIKKQNNKIEMLNIKLNEISFSNLEMEIQSLKETIEKMKQENNKVNTQLTIYKKINEESNKLREELNIRINDIKNEISNNNKIQVDKIIKDFKNEIINNIKEELNNDKNLLSEEIKTKLKDNLDGISKLELRISELEKEINNIKKEKKEIILKSENPIKFEIKKENKKENENVSNIIRNYNLGVEVKKKEDENELEEENFEEYDRENV